jgi:hypothetical protein
MVKQNKKKLIPISEGKWKDIRIRSETAKKLLMIKVEQEFLTYDDAIQFILGGKF